jgi:teichuronic acid biosynthesis glycosyltransferase TuaC
VVFVGWLAPTKGLRELIDATIRLVPSRPRLQLVCIGEGALRAELEAQVTRAGIAGHVRFLGHRAPSEISRWLAAANLFCLASYAEGCPNAVIEALACGRPVIATQVGGIPELVDDACGILVPPGDGAALAKALDQGFDRPWDESGISISSRRGWDQVAADTYDVCMSALDSYKSLVSAR